MTKHDVNDMVRNCSGSIKYMLNRLSDLELANNRQDIVAQIGFLSEIESKAAFSRLSLESELQKEEAERILDDA